MDERTIGVLSCNPAFGGPAKGGLLHEIDALGGYASLGADRAAIQCRILGESRGPAARATRNLVDRITYSALAKEFVANEKNVTVLSGQAAVVLAECGAVQGLKLGDGREFRCGAVVLTGGTFWNGRIYHGLKSTPGGRVGEPPATLLKSSLENLGHRLARLSTSTAPRLLKSTVDVTGLDEQPGDPNARPFSVLSGPPRNLVSCHLTYTNAQTHQIVSENIKSSIIYADDPVSSGPRYCPSLEDKVKRFPHRRRHYVFLEVDGPDLVYPSGLPTGLAPDVQQRLINTIPGLEKTIVARPGYAIEYDISDPTDLEPTLESQKIKGLFMAGQINGTSGYEEAASQGLWAGVGAALRASGSEPFRLGRDQALLGVMLDDLTVAGVDEPYRMFTSRSEWRLSLREDNADLRLSDMALSIGLLDEKRASLFKNKKQAIERFESLLKNVKVSPVQAKDIGDKFGISDIDSTLSVPVSAHDFLKRPGVRLDHLYGVVDQLSEIKTDAALSLEIEIKYSGYLLKQQAEMRRLAQRENLELPADFKFQNVPGLSTEAIEGLNAKKPRTLGQAGRIRGVTPASVSALLIYLTKISRQQPSRRR
jgi:tRNA uridine 5-carboxymethylaminomethyl modification enzyme